MSIADIFLGIGLVMLGAAVMIGIPLAIGWGVAGVIQQAVSAVRRGRTAEGRAARIASGVLSALAILAGSLTVPMIGGFAARWNQTRTPPDLTLTGYHLPLLDPMDAIEFGLLWALVGLVLGLVATGISPSSRAARLGIAVSLAFSSLSLVVGPVWLRPHKSAFKAICLSNVKNLAMAVRMYADDNAGSYPAASEWCDRLKEYVARDEVFLCPASWGTPSSFAYSSTMSGVADSSVQDAASVIAIFESNRGWNAHGGRELLPEEPRHLGGDNYGFADGHAAWMNRERVLSREAEVRWEMGVVAESPEEEGSVEAGD